MITLLLILAFLVSEACDLIVIIVSLTGLCSITREIRVQREEWKLL